MVTNELGSSLLHDLALDCRSNVDHLKGYAADKQKAGDYNKTRQQRRYGECRETQYRSNDLFFERLFLMRKSRLKVLSPLSNFPYSHL